MFGPLVELRKNKGLTDVIAQENLKDNVVLATMMLQLGQVDGLVSRRSEYHGKHDKTKLYNLLKRHLIAR